MFRITAILLLTILVWVQTPIGQLLRISVLIEHYYEHKSGNKDLGILDYLDMHYNTDSDSHPGHDRDMQLPFKHYSPIAFALGTFEHAKFDVTPKIAHEKPEAPISKYQSPYQAKESLAKIWQPPRA